MAIDPNLILQIIILILKIIADGGSVSSAISQAATKFNLSEAEVSEIWRKHGH